MYESWGVGIAVTADEQNGTLRPDLFHLQADVQYAELLKAEQEFWDGKTESLLGATTSERLRRHINERLTGDPGREWFEEISTFGDFTRGCILGAGPGAAERILLTNHDGLRLTIFDIAGDALSRIETNLGPELSGRVETRQADLNFLVLPPNSYDIVVSNASIHHLVNLEHVAFQINSALTEDGYFFLCDYVGESYFQYPAHQRRVFEALIRATRLDEPTFSWPDRSRWDYSPFEAARSGETLEVFRRFMDERVLRTSNALLKMTKALEKKPASRAPSLAGRVASKIRRTAVSLRTRLLGSLVGMESIRRRSAAGSELMYELDGLLSDSRDVIPGLAFAVYAKRSKAVQS